MIWTAHTIPLALCVAEEFCKSKNILILQKPPLFRGGFCDAIYDVPKNKFTDQVARRKPVKSAQSATGMA